MVNLGFSGCALGVIAMLEYTVSLRVSEFVMDYDHNAPAHAHLEATHKAFFFAVRNKAAHTARPHPRCP